MHYFMFPHFLEGTPEFDHDAAHLFLGQFPAIVTADVRLQVCEFTVLKD